MPPTTTAPRWKMIAAFAAVYSIWGSTYLGIRFAIETIPPFFMAGGRFVIAGLMLFAITWLRGAERPRLIHWRSALIVGGLMLLGGNGGVTWAEQHVYSSIAALMVATVPLWMVLLDWLRPGGKRPVSLTFIGLGLGFVGIFLLVGPGEVGGVRGINPVGTVVLLFATLCWSTGSLYSRAAPLPDNGMQATSLEMLAGGVVLVLFGLITGEAGRLDIAAISSRSLIAFIYLTLIGSFVAFSAYIWLLKNTTAVRVATYAYVNPIVAVVLGWLLADEALTPRTLTAAAVIIAAVVLITTARQPAAVEQPVGQAAD